VTAPGSASARRYAGAALAVAQEKRDLQGWLRDLEVMEALLSDAKVAAGFANPSLDNARRVALAISLAGDRLARERLNFFKLLALRRRTRFIGAIRAEFQALVDEAEGRVEVGVVTAREPTPQENEEIAGLLRERAGRETRVQLRVDPSLLGGIVVRRGDRVTDGSVRRRLDIMRQQLISGQA